jgi:hypothetical protein
MSTNTLKKLVAHYAPETVSKQIDNIEAAAALERDARNEKVGREKALLKQIEREAEDRKTTSICIA